MTILYHANQLTAYEKLGYIDLNDYLFDLLKVELQELNIEWLVDIYNEYCDSNSYGRFYENEDEFFETFFDRPMELVRATQFGEYCSTDAYVKFNGYGNVDSFTNTELVHEITEDDNFIEYVLESIDEYSFVDFSEILDNEKEILKLAYKLVAKGY